VDAAWAGFERGYITELMSIEDKARNWLVKAIRAEEDLSAVEALRQQTSGCQKLSDAQRHFVKCIGKLNSIANTQGKGRDDFNVEVLHRATAVVRSEAAADKSFTAITARYLANEVLESFFAMRRYLREVHTCLECVDPHLCKNVGLVARLADVEESWELGALYVQRKRTLNALCEWVSQIKTAQGLSPEFSAMCENCDVELFLVMPRMIWLCYLSNPEMNDELMGTLLPHRFSGRKDFELAIFRKNFEQLQDTLGKNAWYSLVMTAVSGPNASSRGNNPADAFMLELERWSMELQRSNPKDWNQCSSVVMQCLSGGPQKVRDDEFNV
jgi:hypothetical protein